MARLVGETDASSQKQSAYKYSVSYDGNGNVTGFNDSVVHPLVETTKNRDTNPSGIV